MLPSIDLERIKQGIETLATFNATPEKGQGVTRFVFSDEEMEARKYTKKLMEGAGLTVTEDAIGNIFGVLPGTDPSLPPVWSGSHIDTVLNAGKYDGMAGVISAIESCRVIKESGSEHKRSIVAVVFTSEEPTRFSSGCIGSRALTGKLSLEETKNLKDDSGKTLYQVLEERGYDFSQYNKIPVKPGDIHAMLELHIEQAPILEQMKLPIGVVEGICAPTYLHVTIKGEQGHAGSTHMDRRKDTVCAAAEIILKLEELAWKSFNGGNDSTVGTVGKLNAVPNAPNVIAGTTTLVVDIRDVDAESKDKMAEGIIACFKEVEARRGVSIHYEMVENDLPQRSDPRLVSLLERHCQAQKIPYNKMTSGAYHDSLHIAELCPMAMIFVPSKGGISHDPREYTSYEEILTGANILANALLEIANED